MQLLSPLNTKIADQEPAIQLPRDPDKKPMVFHVSSRDDASCNKKPSPFSTPAMPIRRLNTAELSAAQDTLVHPYDRPPLPSMPLSAPMNAAAEKSHYSSTAQKATTPVYDPSAPEPDFPAISKEPVKTASVIRPPCDPDIPSTSSLERLCYLKATQTSQNPQVKDQSQISRSHLLFDKVADHESTIQPLHDPDKHSTSRYLRPLECQHDQPKLVRAQEHAVVLRVRSISRYNGMLPWERSTIQGSYLTEEPEQFYHSLSIERSTLCQYEHPRARAGRHAIATYIECQIREMEDLSDVSHSRPTSAMVTQGQRRHNKNLQHLLAHRVTQLSRHWPLLSELQHTAGYHCLHAGQGHETDGQFKDA